MSSQTLQRKIETRLLDIPAAALQAGYTLRHFRKIVQEDRIPVVRVRHKEFITTRDFEAWQSTRGEARLEQCIQQLDIWLKEDLRRNPEPVVEDNPEFE